MMSACVSKSSSSNNASSESKFDEQVSEFMGDIGDIKEELKLDELTNTFYYKFIRYFLTFASYVSNFYVERHTEGPAGDESGVSHLRFYNLLNRHPKHGAKCPKRYYFILVVLTYIGVRCYLVGYYHIVLDGLQARWKPYAIGKPNSGDRDCSRPEDIVEPDLELKRQLLLLMDKIRGIGSPVTAANTLIAYLAIVLSMIWTMLFLSTLVSRSSKYRLDAINFLETPHLERARIRRRVQQMMRSVFGMVSTTGGSLSRGGMDLHPMSGFRSASDESTATRWQSSASSESTTEQHHQLASTWQPIEPVTGHLGRLDSSDDGDDQTEAEPETFKEYVVSRKAPTMQMGAYGQVLVSEQPPKPKAHHRNSMFNTHNIRAELIEHQAGNKLNHLAKLDSGSSMENDIELAKTYDIDERQEQIVLRNFVLEQNIEQHIVPACINSLSYSRVIKVTAFYIVLFEVFVFVSCWYIISRIYYDELRGRSETRLRSLECARLLPPNGTVVRDLFALPALTTDWQRALYDSSEPNSTNQKDHRLLERLFVESWHLLTRQVLMASVEICAFFVYLACWFTVYICLFVSWFVYMLIWIRQVQDQLSACLRLLEHYAQIRAHDNLAQRRKVLAKTLVITYFNFNLLRTEFKQTRLLANYVAAVLFAIGIGATAISYLVFSMTASRNIAFIWATNIFCLISMNSLLFAGGSLTKNIETLFHKLAELMAKASQNSMELSYIISLMRRQIMSDREVRKLHSIQAFELEFSQEVMISLNSYLLVVWLVMWRSHFF